MLEAHRADGDAHAAIVERADQRVAVHAQSRLGVFLGEAPQLAAAIDRRSVIEEHRQRVVALFAFELHRHDLARFGVIAEPGRIRHANELVFDDRLVEGERLGDHRVERVAVGPVGDDEIFAIDEAVGSRRESGTGQRHGEGAFPHVGKLHRRRSSGWVSISRVRSNTRYALLGAGAVLPVGMVERVLHVGAPGRPMLLHRVARELIIVGLRPIGRTAVNEQHDGDGGVAGHAIEDLPIFIVAELRRDHGPQVANGPADGLHLAEDVGVEPGPARKADFLLPLADIEQGLRQAAFGAEQVDLEDAHVLARAAALEHIFERRVGNQPAVPIGLAVDLDGRETRRQRAARHHMLRTDPLLGRVEIFHVAGQHLHRADAQADLARVQQVEIDKLHERDLQRVGIVDADRLRRALRHEHGGRHARLEEARHAAHGGERGAGLVENAARIVVGAERPGEQATGDTLPEFAQSRCPTVGRVAGDDGRIDGADGDAGKPSRHVAGVAQGFVGAGLIGAERPAALQHQHRFFVEGSHDSDLLFWRGTASANYAGAPADIQGGFI